MAEQNEYIKEAYECLEKMSADERKRREYEERQKILWDHNSFMKSAKIIGMREGREEGRKEGYREALVSIVIKKIAKRDVSRGNCRFSGRGCLDDTENL